MKQFFSKLSVVGALLSATCFINVANATVIFSEDFSGGSTSLKNSSTVKWTDTSGGGFEVYKSTGANARKMSSTYDHDNDATTAQVKIPGAIEVNDDKGNETLSATFTFDSVINDTQAFLLTFFSGVRSNATGSSVEVYNVSQGISLSGLLVPVLNGAEWVYNSFSFDGATTVTGDTLQISWIGGGTNSANGLEVADVKLSVVDVPAPATAAILALGLAGLGFRRFKK